MGENIVGFKFKINNAVLNAFFKYKIKNKKKANKNVIIINLPNKFK